MTLRHAPTRRPARSQRCPACHLQLPLKWNARSRSPILAFPQRILLTLVALLVPAMALGEPADPAPDTDQQVDALIIGALSATPNGTIAPASAPIFAPRAEPVPPVMRNETAGSDSKSDSDADSDSNPDSKSDSDPETDPDVDLDSNSDSDLAESDPDIDTDSDWDAASGSDSDTGPESASDAGSGSETATAPPASPNPGTTSEVNGLDAVPTPDRGIARYYGRPVASVELEGGGTTQELVDSLPLRRGSRLSRHNLQHSVRGLYRTDRFARVEVRVREWRADDPNGPLRVIFRVEPVRRVMRVGFVGLRALDEGALRSSVELPPGTEFTPDRVDHAARQVALTAFRLGYRNAFVRWDATPIGDDVAIDFSLSEGGPTVLKKLFFVGDPGLLPADLKAAIPLSPGDPLSLVTLENGVPELRAALRRQGFLRARVYPPRVTVTGLNAVVEIPVDAGPRFQFHVRGNRSFSESLLLSQLRYSGEEPLDAAMQRELAERLRAFYELAGHAEARVLVRETPSATSGTSSSTRPPSWSERRQQTPASLNPLHPVEKEEQRHAAREERTITFVVSEGPRLHVVDRVFEGVRAFDASELNRRIDLILEDSMPPVLLGGRDPALLRASFVSSAPAPADAAAMSRDRPRVRPREVFAEAPYRAACSEIEDLYRSRGYLEAVVGPATLERLDDERARVVVPVREGARTVVTRIEFRAEEPVDERALRQVMRIRECDPLSFFSVEESRNAALQQLLARGHFYASVEAVDEPAPESDESCGALNGEEVSRAVVAFYVRPGPVVRVGRVEVRGAVKTRESVVSDAIALSPGDPITPYSRQQSVQNLMRLGLFNSASVDPADPDVVENEKTIIVDVREKPTLSAELRFGGSLADGPRISGHLLRSYLGGRNRSLTANAKLNWPAFRLLMEQQTCERELSASGGAGSASCGLPDDPIERRLNVGLLLPQLRASGGPAVELRTEAVHENLLRPSYQLSRFALLGAVDGLLRGRVGMYDVSTLLEAELEHATYGSRQYSTGLPETMADLLARRMPEGTVLLASLRPTLTIDGRDDRFNPTRGIVASLSLDLSRSLFAREPSEADSRPFDVALIRALMSARGYVPLRDDGRVVLAFAGNFGTVLKQPESRVIGTKRFFLGGTASVRGFNEDAIVAEDERARLHEARELCASGSILPDGALPCDAPVLQSLASGNYRSEGGEVMASGRAELRLALGGAFGAGFFVDAGNLWLDPSEMNLTQLRYAAGAGLRFALPIGPAAFDVGVNLNPDLVFYEPRLRVHLSVGLF